MAGTAAAIGSTDRPITIALTEAEAEPSTAPMAVTRLSERRAAQARLTADAVALAAAAKISDLDEEETPESIMLSSMTEEGAKDRTDREVVPEGQNDQSTQDRSYGCLCRWIFFSRCQLLLYTYTTVCGLSMLSIVSHSFIT